LSPLFQRNTVVYILQLILWFGGIPWLWLVSGLLLEKCGYGGGYEVNNCYILQC